MKGIRRMDKKIEALVLTDGEGAYFAVPLDALEAYRVGGRNVDGFVAGLGVDDVQGFDAANTPRRGSPSRLRHGQPRRLPGAGREFRRCDPVGRRAGTRLPVGQILIGDAGRD